MLLPVLAKAKYAGMRTAGINNIRQQYLSQFLYADDFKGHFAHHEDGSPDYHRLGGAKDRIVTVMRGSDVKNTAILICPITAKTIGRVWLNDSSMPNFAHATTKDYGGWDTTAGNVDTPYMGIANFKFTPAMKFLETQGKVNTDPEQNEPVWPSTEDECDSRKAFITHRISDTPGTLGNSSPATGPTRCGSFPSHPSNPLAKADGSVIIRARGMGGPSADTRGGSQRGTGSSRISEALIRSGSTRPIP